MTGLRYLMLALVALCGLPAWSAIQVKSGEHETFTRLVVYFEPGQQWDLEKTDLGYRLTAAGLSDGFDLSDVFRLITRERIASVAGSPDVLALELGCDCSIRSEVLPAGYLILDVAEALETTAGQDVTPPEVDDAQPVILSDPASAREEQTPIALPQTRSTSEVDIDPTKPVAVEELTAFRRRLLENLGRSASLSLVDLAENGTQGPLNPQANLNLNMTAAEQAERTRVSNAVDEALKRAASDRKPMESLRCPDPSVFNVASWGGDLEFSDHIAMLRRNLIQEFDRIDQAQVISLARAYLYYGLVEESSYALAQFDPPGRERDALSVLVRVMEGTSTAPIEALVGFDHCEGPIIPWLVLNAPRTTDLAEARRQGLVSEFARWPKTLQSLLGPRLMSAMNARGYETTASVLNAYLSGVAETSALDKTTDQSSLSEILGRVDGGSEKSTTALATYLRRAMDEDVAIDTKLLELSAALERETGGTPISGKLFALRLEAMAARGDVPMVLSEIENLPSGVADISEDTLLRISEQVLTLPAFDPIVRFSVFAERTKAVERLPFDIIERLATRHVEMGLPEVASTLLDLHGSGARSRDLAVALADADGRVDEAVAVLAQTPGAETAGRTAELLLKYDRANQLTDAQRADLPQPMQDRVAWATSDWENVGGDNRLSAASQLIVDLQNANLEDAPLTKAKDIQTKSAASRSILSELLESSSQ